MHFALFCTVGDKNALNTNMNGHPYKKIIKYIYIVLYFFIYYNLFLTPHTGQNGQTAFFQAIQGNHKKVLNI